jgi:hypothetical protein
MRVERIEGALILRPGTGEWYNQRVWDMFEDVDLPPARWHAEIDAAIRSHESHPSIVVIDATEMAYLVAGDYGFFVTLSKRLDSAGTRLTVVARPNELRACEVVRLQEYFDMVGTLDEALREP